MPQKHQPDEAVKIPTTMPGLMASLLAKYGLGIVGFILLVPVYQDNKAANREHMLLLKESIAATNATSKAMETLSSRIEEGHTKVAEMKDVVREISASLRRIETSNPKL